MTRLYPALLLFLTASALATAQTFRLETTPRSTTARPGETVTYHVDVVPLDGYRATVNLHVLFPTLGGAIFTDPGKLNAPYTGGASFSITAQVSHAGVLPLVVEGWNGTLFVRDTVTLVVDASRELAGWTHFATRNSAIPGNTIRALEIDPSAAVWIATDRGPARYDGEWRSWPAEFMLSEADSLLPTETTSIALDSSGGAWVSGFAAVHHYSNGIWRHWTTAQGTLPPNARTTHHDIAVAPDGSVYAAGNEGVFRFDGSEWRQMEGSPRMVSRIAIDREGAIDVMAGESLGRFDGAFWSLYSLEEMQVYHRFNDETFDDEWNRWIVYATGLMRERDGVRSYVHNGNVFTTTYTSVDFAPDGAIWIGGTGGLASKRGDAWTVYSTINSGLPAPHVTEVRVAHDGRVYVGTAGGGLAIYDPAITSSVDRIEHIVPLHIVPNPASDRFTVRMSTASPTHVRATLADITGRVHRVVDASAQHAGVVDIAVDLAGVPTGAYIISVAHGGHIEHARVVVAH
jgi:hypothetical protein